MPVWVSRAVLAVAVCLVAFGGRAQEIEAPPIPVDLIEETGIALALLEVEVRDAKGNPIPGLSKDDFKVVINGRTREIYSLDDLCPTEAPARIADARSTGPGASDPASTPVASTESEIDPTETRYYVLYFDFSQFAQDGRINALAAARRWIRESMGPGDLVQLVGYASRTGLTRFTEFSPHREDLLVALDAIRDDPGMIDTFVENSEVRIRCCGGSARDPFCPYSDEDLTTPPCREWAYEAYVHGRRGMKALEGYLVGLDNIPGRKALILFQQDGSIFPSRRYGVRAERAGDMVSAMDRVAAEANLSRTAIYGVQPGDINGIRSRDGVNMNANFADFTGGAYNRGDADLDGFLSRAGREHRCLYQIGIRRPDQARERVLRARVLLHDKPLPGHFRIRFLDRVDRWWRRARAVLTSPATATDFRIATSAVPLAAGKTGWRVRLRIAVDAQSLDTIRLQSRQQGDWEVGALLSRQESTKSWEFLGISRVESDEAIAESSWIVHERTVEDLKAGEYRLGAFVRDSTANLFGGAESLVVLPNPNRPGVSGPLLLLADRIYLSASLPALEKGKKKARERGATKAAAREGWVPAAAVIDEGESVDAISVICAGEDRIPQSDRLLRFVSREEEPLFRFEPPKLEPAGRCHRLVDRIETGALDPGRYAYHLWWQSGDDDREQLKLDVKFDVVGPELEIIPFVPPTEG